VVAPTASGIDALERLNARVDAAQDALLAALSEEERRELQRLLTLLTTRSA
jgi:DNA-binding MarR family transcriptional regulator